MKMIPPQPCDTGSSAEFKLFNRFSRTIALGPDAVCFHSVTIANHVNQRSGEADFVVVCSRGLFVFEVKGGSVSRDEHGIWHFQDRWGDDHISRRGPFVQAREALYSIKRLVDEELDPGLAARLCIGFGVMMPDCLFDAKGVEWDAHTVLTAKDVDFFDHWLRQLAGYWMSRDPRPGKRLLSPEEIAMISGCLRPAVSPEPRLSVLVEQVHSRMTAATREQCNLLDVAEANPRVLFQGGAGTGKREMALELAGRLQGSGRVLVVCRSLWLCRFMAAAHGRGDVHFRTIDQEADNAGKNDARAGDILIVLEGETMTSGHDLGILDILVTGGLSRGRWYYFSDRNSQAGTPAPDSRAFQVPAALRASNPVQVPLKRNCRNTRGIVRKIRQMTGLDPGEGGSGPGPGVRVLLCESGPEHLLAKELERLSMTGALPLGNIAILSPAGFKDSCAARLNAVSRSRIHVLDNNRAQSLPLRDSVVYAPIHWFRSLESRCVILVDIGPEDFQTRPYLLYLGMSRATACLSLILSGNGVS